MTFRLPDLLWVNRLTEPLLSLFPPESGDVDPSENDTNNNYYYYSLQSDINTSRTTCTCRCNIEVNTNINTNTNTSEEDVGNRQRLVVLKRKINSMGGSKGSDVSSSAFCKLCSEF